MDSTLTNRATLLTGRTIFTVTSPKGRTFTYRVRKLANGRDQPLYTVNVKAKIKGSSMPFAFLGIMDPVGGNVRVTVRSRFTSDSMECKVANWVCQMIIREKPWPDGYSVGFR